MRFLLIPDKFKGSLSAEKVMDSIIEGISSVHPSAEFRRVLASDGGDGFLDAVSKYTPTTRIYHTATDPLGREREVSYLYNREKREAFIELAAASGLVLLKDGERSASNTSTYGTGMQIRHAIGQGAKSVYVGLGGSATNDGGTGIAAALGYRFLDSRGVELEPIGANLPKIAEINRALIPEPVKKVAFTAINDVNNPLFGPEGAAYVYAAQKGADPEAIRMLDDGLQNLHTRVSSAFGRQLADVPGTGAAGGTSFGLMAFCDASFISGIEFILQLSGISKSLQNEKIDYLITGEGKIDRQTLSGKLINGVLTLGRKHQIPVIAVCGKLEIGLEELKEAGLLDAIEIGVPGKPLEYNMQHAARLLRTAVSAYFTNLKLR